MPMMNRTNSVARIIRFVGAIKHLTQGYTRTGESKKEESEDQWSFRRCCDQHVELVAEPGWIPSTADLSVQNTASVKGVPATASLEGSAAATSVYMALKFRWR